MGIGALDYKKGGSGLNINGIIEDYYVYAGENVNAGDFVEFINGVGGVENSVSNKISLDTRQYSAQYNMSAVELENKKVFVAHSIGSGSSCYLHGTLLNINASEIIVETTMQLTTIEYTGEVFSMIALGSDKFCICIRGEGNYYLYAMVIEVQGSTINCGAMTALATTESSGRTISACVLDENKIFIAHSYKKGSGSSTNYIIYGDVCTIQDLAITKNSTKEIVTVSNSGLTIHCRQLDKNKVVLLHGNGSHRMHGVIVTCSNTALTVGTDTQLNSTNNSSRYMQSYLYGNNLFVIHDGTGTKLYGSIIVVSGSTVSITATNTVLCDVEKSGQYTALDAIDEKNIFVLHAVDSTNYYLYGTICSIDGATITHGTNTQLGAAQTGTKGKAVKLLSNGAFLTLTGNGSYCRMYGQLFGIDKANQVPTNQIEIIAYETQVRLATTLPCNGVASTSGEGGDDTGRKDIVSVYTVEMPKPTNLIANGDFSNGLENWSDNDPTTATSEIENNYLKINYLKTLTTSMYYGCTNNKIEQAILGHKYYWSIKVKADNTVTGTITFTLSCGAALNYKNELSVNKNGEWQTFSNIIEVAENPTYDHTRAMLLLKTPINGNVVYWDDIKIYDLTAIFGAGNEPSQEWCDANL